eukprot:7514158-Alexandrium_andersonii.AAC.1
MEKRNGDACKRALLCERVCVEEGKTQILLRTRCAVVQEQQTPSCLGHGAFEHPKQRGIANVE